MNEMVDTLLDGLLEREREAGSVLTWAGSDYPCSGGAEFGGKQLDLGGFKLKAEVTIVVRTSIFPAGTGLPQEKQTVAYLSTAGATVRNLRIESVTPVYGALLVLECNDPSRGA